MILSDLQLIAVSQNELWHTCALDNLTMKAYIPSFKTRVQNILEPGPTITPNDYIHSLARRKWLSHGNEGGRALDVDTMSNARHGANDRCGATDSAPDRLPCQRLAA